MPLILRKALKGGIMILPEVKLTSLSTILHSSLEMISGAWYKGSWAR